MSDPIQTLRVATACKFDCSAHEPTVAALTQVENLVRAARNALPCVDRNATLPAQTLADALAPFGDTP